MLLRLSPVQDGQKIPATVMTRPASLLVHLGMTGHIASDSPEKPWKNTLMQFSLWMMGENALHGCAAIWTAGILVRELCCGSWNDLAPIRWKWRPRSLRRHSFAKSRIKAILLDQTVLRGVGNIYADESLWKRKFIQQKSLRG